MVMCPVLLPTSCAKATQRTPCSNARLVIMKGPISLPSRCSGNCCTHREGSSSNPWGIRPARDGEELAGLCYHPLARGGRLEQFSGCRKYGRREFLFETTGEQPFQNVVGGTQIGDLFFSHGDHLMFGRRTHHGTTAEPTGLSVSDGASAGNEPVSIANLFGNDFVAPSAWHSTHAQHYASQA